MAVIIPKNLKQIDKELRDLVVKFELLSFVSPINSDKEKKAFFKSNFKTNPNFLYKKLEINPIELKRKLALIQTEKIADEKVRIMYEDTIESYIEKVDMLSNLGNKKFLYSSLKYFGQPNSNDLKQAQFLLMCPNFKEEEDAPIYNAQEAAAEFSAAKERMGFTYRVEVKRDMVARALVSNAKQKVYINKNIMFSKRDIEGLIEHEVGIHLLTTKNGKLQPLRIFSLGLPNNTKTQEGLAVATEYLSDNINLVRLRELALRVIAVDMMVEGNDFRTTFLYLVENYKYDENKAFSLTTRVYRGGGFTKDYLYIRGLRVIINELKKGTDLTSLLIGKTSIDYLSTLNYMIDNQLAFRPKYPSEFLVENGTKNTHPILRYILEGLAD